MTTGCSHSKPKKNRLGPFTFNPFEIAVSGPDAKALVQYLKAGPLADLELGHLVSVDEKPGLGDEYLPPRSLLDADAVLVEGDGYPDISDFTLDQQDAVGEAVLKHFSEKVDATPLKGLILAGGQSTRMQRDKAALDFHGKSQIDRVNELLRPLCGEVFVSIRPDQSNDPVRTTLPQIHDTFLEMGPMGGILSALRADPHVAWLVVACDLPFIDEETLRLLVEGRNPFRFATAFTSARDGFPEPLCAIYEPKSVMRLLQFLAMGYDCPRKVLINSRTQLLEPPNDVVLSNVNHPDEYEAALKVLQADKAT